MRTPTVQLPRLGHTGRQRSGRLRCSSASSFIVLTVRAKLEQIPVRLQHNLHA